MIHMSQVKVPVKELVKKAEPELFFFRASIDFFSIQKKVISSIGILISFAAAFLTSSSSAFPIFPLQKIVSNRKWQMKFYKQSAKKRMLSWKRYKLCMECHAAFFGRRCD